MNIKEYRVYRAKSYAISIKKDRSLVDCYYHIKALSRLKPIIRQVEARKLVGRGVKFLDKEGELKHMHLDSDFFRAEVNYYQTWRGLRKLVGRFGKHELVNVVRGWK
ncbi:hypothetical protein 6939_0025 [Klebsiella phage 6939]|uniref:Uncharacterized protein n=1 Tax=Klebsiella phage 6939 TaxID=2912295 RepID=A0A9E7M7E7_9CAUD|nr:hypothetical protein 6939_0025 [Klebsiella phage 6939]